MIHLEAVADADAFAVVDEAAGRPRAPPKVRLLLRTSTAQFISHWIMAAMRQSFRHVSQTTARCNSGASKCALVAFVAFGVMFT